MSPRAQNLLSLATLAISLVIASFPTKAQSATINRASSEFLGIAGQTGTPIERGEHFYDFDYKLK